MIKSAKRALRDISPLSNPALRTIPGNIFWAILCTVATFYSIRDGFKDSPLYLIICPFTLLACGLNMFYAMQKIGNILKKFFPKEEVPLIEPLDKNAFISSCPCLYLKESCHKNCTCVHGFSSLGCKNCCTYGSVEQRTKMAVKLNNFRLFGEQNDKPFKND